MQHEFYTLPLDLQNMILKKEVRKCSLKQSVAQHLHLILTTAFGELASDENFGCRIWEFEFDHLTTSYTVKDIIRESLWQTILNEEKRLVNIAVEIQVNQAELQVGRPGRLAKKRIGIAISGESPLLLI